MMEGENCLQRAPLSRRITALCMGLGKRECCVILLDEDSLGAAASLYFPCDPDDYLEYGRG